MPPTAQSLGALLKSARDIMRKDKGLNGDLDRLPMLTWIMFLKFLDDLELGGMGPPGFSGPKARHVIAWAEASPTSGGPGQPSPRISQGLKGRPDLRTHQVPPFQGGEIGVGTLSRGFTPGHHISGFQPAEPPIVNVERRSARIPGPKARHVTARPEGPGNPSPQIFPAL